MGDLIGQSLGRYHVVEQLGEGGMAIVYRAYDTRLERDVAIKVIRRDAFPPDQLSQMLKRFEREAKALAKLSHPNIVRVLDYGEHEGSPYLVMEYLPGGTLKHRLGKVIPWREALQLLLPISQALGYAHEHKVIHRDIKPSNILLTEAGQPMLTDFGIAKILEVQETASLTSSGMIMGTPEYMAPEQWTGETTAQSDIYSLGVVLYEMVTGRRPYTADTPAAILLKQATDPLPRPRGYVPGLPEDIEKTLLKALAKQAGDRYQDMPALIRAFERLLAGEVPIQPVYEQEKKIAEAPRTEPRPRPPERTSTHPPVSPSRSPNVMRFWPLAVIGLLLAGAAGLIGIFGAYTWWNSATDSPPQTLTPEVEINLPVSTSTIPSTHPVPATSTALKPVIPTNTSISTEVPQPGPTSPILETAHFTAATNMFCYDGPSTGYESHWELYSGQTVTVLARWSGNSEWLVVDIDEPDKTRTDCCWVESHKGSLNLSLEQVRSTTLVPDRMDCSALQ